MERVVQKVKFPPRQPKLKRVAAYARVSSGKDAMLHSLAAQVEYYSNYIRRHPGWEYVGVYADEAKTGTKDSREQFQLQSREDRPHPDQVHFPDGPEYGDPAGNGSGTESYGHHRVL